MKLYAILGRYYGTQAEAKAAAKEGDVKFDPAQDTVDVPTDKEGLIGYLNRLSDAIERDPITEDEYTTVVERQDPPVETGPSHTETSIAIDDAWDALPLARKAHFVELFGAEVRTTANQLSAKPTIADNAAAGAAAVDELFS